MNDEYGGIVMYRLALFLSDVVPSPRPRPPRPVSDWYSLVLWIPLIIVIVWHISGRMKDRP